MEYKGFRDLKVYQLSYRLSLEIFQITKSFPKDEKYSLVDQIRRSSRSIPSNIAEAWRKRIYIKSFVSKLIDSFGEEGETEVLNPDESGNLPRAERIGIKVANQFP